MFALTEEHRESKDWTTVITDWKVYTKKNKELI